MKKRYLQILIASLVMSSLVTTTALAAPDVSSIQEKKDEAQAELDSFQSQLTEIMVQINDMENKLIETGNEIEKAKKDLQTAEEKEKQQYEDMKLRIKYMYEGGDNSVLEKIAESGSISEVLNQAEYVQKVHNYDREQLAEYVKTKETIADLKETLEEEQRAQEEQQKEFQAKKEEQEILIAEKKDEVADIDAELQAAVEAAEREREEEERKRREAEEAQKAQNDQPANNNTPAANYDPAPDTSYQGGGSTSTGSNADVSYGGGNTSAAQTIVNAAYSQLGVPYVWGGTTAYSGLDCSGLVQYCHAVAGISIARTSGPQGAGGIAVSEPQPGDVVCYGGHVGIYIGGGQMIHAPEPGDVVKIQSVYGNPWYRRYW